MSVHCHLMGGLGNQLFQIFAAAGYAIQSKKQLQCHFESTGTPRKSYNALVQHCLDRLKDASQHRQIESKHFAQVEFPKYHNLELFGQFQNPKYFEPYFAQILDLLKIRIPERPLQEGTVLHIRRSDFKTSACHELLSLDYYKQQVIGMPKPQTILTDDASDAFVHQVCEQLGASVQQSKDSSQPELDEFWLMVHCNHIVMSNSTFAWWATRFALHRNPQCVIRECPKFLKEAGSQIPLPLLVTK